ncbi:hypothetical protein [Brachybacterium sacelli]|uniref:hypothetical protein n=1 Tax=Brachybacterium sacelli TaxID=173364 RepID=UPI0033838B54
MNCQEAPWPWGTEQGATREQRESRHDEEGPPEVEDTGEHTDQNGSVDSGAEDCRPFGVGGQISR